MIMAGHQGQKFVCYPITPPATDGRQELNWVAELPVAELPPPQDWSREVDRGRFRDAFATWRFGWLDVPTLIDGAERVYEYPLADHDPLDRWGNGRVTLLGDAAHPMYPIGRTARPRRSSTPRRWDGDAGPGDPSPRSRLPGRAPGARRAGSSSRTAATGPNR